ncbi:sigma-54-dependent Fis family transcriptional regulator [Salinisphaera orenii]|uniref:sigma-54-dependent Fis family transcriptional regulator n=1 Tax=Salinisphaera orenii TaxID=856731 RepID=UPI000F4B7AC6|nr:sigma-54-dependent Fis family transcriptional regulator [Salinisphaera orenii]
MPCQYKPSYPSTRDLVQALRFLPEEGQIWLGEQRMLLMPLQASAFFREELVRHLGMERAKGLFMRLGYHAGLRDAELGHTLRDRPEQLEESYFAGPQLHALQGQVLAVPIALDMDLENDRFYSEFVWENSFEVDAWRAQGLQNEPVCWTLLGYASAYASHLFGREVQFRELECRGRGDARCRIVGRLAHEWADHESFAEYFRADPLINELHELQDQMATLQADIARTRADQPPSATGRSRAFRNMLALLDSTAPTEVPILLHGETGTGKEVLARRIHQGSHRAEGPFVAINCAAIPPDLVEAELFGAEKGAFTGATERRIGRFERASGGTLFLDEVAELSPRAQAALLRVLEENEIERVGGQSVISVNVRLVAATHADLSVRVEDGQFRKDLFYRLNSMTLRIPALRERMDDIVEFAEQFRHNFETQYEHHTLGFTDQAVSALKRHQWPGNIRELKNTVERGVILTAPRTRIVEHALFAQAPQSTGAQANSHRLDAQGHIEIRDMPNEQTDLTTLVKPLFAAGKSLDEIEQTMIQIALNANNGNVSSAARSVGMSRATFDYRHKKYK